MASQNPRLGDWLARARRLDSRWISIGQVPFAHKAAVERDVLMAGDAAQLIAPVAGDGIAMALRGGQLAAAHVARFLSGRASPADLRREYATAWGRAFGLRLRLARFVQAFMLRPAWLSPGLRLLQAVPPLGSFLMTHTREASARS
jgi:flavin-dependent dehydrogenase